MNETIKIVKNRGKVKDYSFASAFGKQQAESVRSYHQSFPQYRSTELKSLKHLAEYLGIGDFYVKDESSRFGLNAFKGLGGSYCIGRYIGENAEFRKMSSAIKN